LSGDPLRVVFVTTVFDGNDTGPATYARYLWREFRNDPEIEFHVVAPSIGEQHPRLHPTGEPRGSLRLYRLVQQSGRRLAESLGPTTIVHGNSTHSMGHFRGYAAPWLVQVNDYELALFPERARRILIEHGPRRFLSSGWRRHMERRVLSAASVAVCNSGYTATKISAAYSVPSERLRVVHKAVDLGAFKRPDELPTDPFPPSSRRGFRLVFVGSDWHRKGLDAVLAGLAEVREELAEVSLCAIGPDPDDQELRDLIRQSGLDGAVSLPGQLPPDLVAAHLWHADIFVLPSRREALGVAVLEAMAAGVPVIATRIGGIPEIVRNEREGILVGADRVVELAAAMRKLLKEPVSRTSLALAGRIRAEDFSVRGMSDSIRNIYLSLNASRGRLN
jgi:glycosyltransferase involved in cell wall biosynthesis